jgi:hypothetical protein
MDRRGLADVAGSVFKTLFSVATVVDLNKLHYSVNKLQGTQSDLVHSVNEELTHLRSPDSAVKFNSKSVKSLSENVKSMMLKSQLCAPPDTATDVEVINPHLLVPPLLPPPPAIDRVLFRRAFFINPERTKYVSVGFYSSQNYEPYLEIGGARLKPIVLSQQDVTTLAERLPDLFQAMYRHEQYAFGDGMFRLTTTRGYKTARITFDRYYISFKLEELRYLSNMFYVLQNQLTYYTLALPDLLNYVAKALSSTIYV